MKNNINGKSKFTEKVKNGNFNFKTLIWYFTMCHPIQNFLLAPRVV